MCGRKNQRGCCDSKSLTDKMDLFAEPVYHFTFRDSYVVSTCVGSLCTVALIFVLVLVLGTKTQTFLLQDPNTFIVTEGIDFGHFDEDAEFDKHLLAVGFTYKAEFQDQMTDQFHARLAQIVDIKMFTREKKDGAITTSAPLKLDPCSTLDLNKFYSPRQSSLSAFNYIQDYKPMQCLDESANLTIAPTRQQSSQVIDGVAVNERVIATRGGQDIKLRGNNSNRHDNWREFLFQVDPCVSSASVTCIANPEAELQKMELMLFYNTERFDKRSSDLVPVARDSVVRHFDFNPSKKYEMKAVITQGNVDQNLGLFQTSSAEFFQMDLGSLTESTSITQTSYIVGSLGMSSDRLHV